MKFSNHAVLKNIDFDIEKELGIEVVGDTKVKIMVEDDEDKWEVFDDNVINACEKLLGAVLGVSDSLLQYITDESLIENCSKLLDNNPSFFQAN